MKTLYKTVHKISYELKSHVSDEQLKKNLVHQIIEDMPMEYLAKIFRFEMLDPYSDDSKFKLSDPSTSESEKYRILQNREDGMLEYEASIYVSDDL